MHFETALPRPHPLHAPTRDWLQKRAAPSKPWHLALPTQAAVPKYITLKLEPASGTTVPAAGAGGVQQRIWLTNTLQGSKPLAIRLRVSFTDGAGQQVVDQTTVDNLPEGL